VDAWLDGARMELARAASLEPGALELDAQASALILELARIAAHDSEKRTNAPLLCYLVGLAVGRGASLEHVADAVPRSSS
jgi:Domain of unknown function (DUF6457)